jgi:DNA repair protein RadC
MKFSKSQHEAIQRVFDLVAGTDRASHRSRKATLKSTYKMKRVLEAELRIKVAELEIAVFTDDRAQITREIKILKKHIRQTAEILRHIALYAADKEIAAAVTAELM